MKLLKKLLPIASVASVAAIVAPVVTSCGSNSMFDGYNLYMPKSAKAVWDHEKFPNGYKAVDAINLYLTDVKNNPDVLVDDMYLRLSMNFIDERDWDERNNRSFKCAANIKYENIVANPTDSTLSLKIWGSGYIEISGVLLMNLRNFSFDAKNIPYYANQIDDDFGWEIYCDIDDVIESKNVSVNTTIDGYFVYDGNLCNFNNESFFFDKDHAYKTLTKTQQTAIEQILDTFGKVFRSYHMQDIQHYIDPEK